MGKGIRLYPARMEDMKTYKRHTREYHSLGQITTPVTIETTTAWRGNPYTYTAVPMEMLDSLRAMIKACGFKCTTYYVGHRPPAFMDLAVFGHRGGWSRISGTTRKENARWAKLLVSDPKTGKREYL